MRNIVRAVLVGLGAFFLVLAGLMRFWAPSHVEKTPLKTDAVVYASGPAKVLNNKTFQVEDHTLRATRTLQVDSTASDKNVMSSSKKNIVMVETLCIVKVIGDTPDCVDAHDSQARLLQFTTDRRAENAHTSEAVNDPKYGENVNGDTSVRHVGLGYKFPFNSQKKTYKFFDTTVNKPFDAVYSGTKKIQGINTYHYVVTITGEKTNLIPGLEVTYDNTRDIWVDPVTGVIVDGREHQVQTLAGGVTAIDAVLSFEDRSVKDQVKLAKDGRSKLGLLKVTAPAILVALAIAAFAQFVLMGRRSGGTAAPAEDGFVPLHSGKGAKTK